MVRLSYVIAYVDANDAYRSAFSIALVISTVRTLTVVARRRRSMTFSL